MRLGFNSQPREKFWLLVIVAAGLINGLLHAFLVPPWQHYDEPGHFEFAWLIANKPGLPEPGDYIQSMRREVAASMIEHDFFANIGFRPNLVSVTEPVWIGISQTDDPPLYYMLVAIPLYLVRSTDITFQLYLGRMVSLSLFLLALYGSYGIISELTPPGSSLRVLVPTTVALIPGFADIMTAVNNDVGAAAFFTLFLWLSVRMLLRGFTWLNAIFLLILSGVCIFTKSTTILVIPLMILAITLSLLPSDQKILGWGVFSLTGLVLLGLSITLNGVAFWHDRTQDKEMQHAFDEIAPDGQYALGVKSPNSNSPSNVIQLIPPADVATLRGKSVTIGAWIWASSNLQTRTPVLDDGKNTHFGTIDVDTHPAFFAYTAEVDEHANQLSVRLQSLRQPEDANASVFYDGVVLVEGDHSPDGKPSFLDAKSDQVEWDGKILTNYIRNASFEKSAPQFRPQIDKLLETYLPDRLSLVISSLVDIEGYRSYYTSAVQHLFRSFWGVFGWGDVYLVGSKPYRILLIIALIAPIGDVIYLKRKWHVLPLHTLGFLGLSLIGVWAMVTTRGVGSVFFGLFIPAARYAYPVIVPTVLLFTIGWREIMKIIGERPKISETIQNIAYLSFLLIFNAISVFSIISYYKAL